MSESMIVVLEEKIAYWEAECRRLEAIRLQEFAAAYTEKELSKEMEILEARASDLKATVTRLAGSPGATA